MGRIIIFSLLMQVTNLGLAQASLYLHELRAYRTIEVEIHRPDDRAWERTTRATFRHEEMAEITENFLKQLNEDLQLVHVAEPHVVSVKVEEIEILKVVRAEDRSLKSAKANVLFKFAFLAEEAERRLPTMEYIYFGIKDVNHINVEVKLTHDGQSQSFFFELDEKSAERWVDNGHFDFTSLHLGGEKYDKLRTEISEWLRGKDSRYVKVEGFLHLEASPRERVVPFQARDLLKDLKLTGMGSYWQDVKAACRRILE